MGLLAFGGCAMGWTAAQGGMAIARDFAQGGVAVARHANDAVAAAFIQSSAFVKSALAAMDYAGWLNLLWLLPLGVGLAEAPSLAAAAHARARIARPNAASRQKAVRL
jgi:hypothetical protein